MTAKQHQCPECGQATSGQRARFCSTSCRMAFNNRRMQRGAQAYDLFRALRRERDTAKKLNIWTELCRLELIWQEEDEAARPGRRSYIAPQVALAHLRDVGAIPRGVLLAKSHRVGR